MGLSGRTTRDVVRKNCDPSTEVFKAFHYVYEDALNRLDGIPHRQLVHDAYAAFEALDQGEQRRILNGWRYMKRRTDPMEIVGSYRAVHGVRLQSEGEDGPDGRWVDDTLTTATHCVIADAQQLEGGVTVSIREGVSQSQALDLLERMTRMVRDRWPELMERDHLSVDRDGALVHAFSPDPKRESGTSEPMTIPQPASKTDVQKVEQTRRRVAV